MTELEKENFGTYQQALDLNKLGFNEPCIGWATLQYEDIIHIGNKFKVHLETDLPTRPFGVPLKQQVFKFFRDKYKIFCYPDPTGSWRYSCKYRLEDKQGKHWVGYMKDKDGNILIFNSHEESESACIDKLIELAKQQKS